MFVGAASASNIQPAPALLEAWASLRADPDPGVRALQMQVRGEALELVQTLQRRGSAKEDWEAQVKGRILTDTESCFLLFALDGADPASTSSSSPLPRWVLVSYIPVATAVRNKMLYSSTLRGLKQALGLFVVYSADDEASFEEMVEKAQSSTSHGSAAARHGGGGGASQRLRSVQQRGAGSGEGIGGGASDGVQEDAPLTELEKLKLAEQHMEVDKRVRLPGLKAGAPFTLHDDARTALQALAATAAADAATGGANWLELSVHADGEQVRLAGSKTVPALHAIELEDARQMESEIASIIASAEARFFIVAIRSKLLFLYYCPVEAPVRSKMSYSVQKRTTVDQAEAALGRRFDAVVEAQELADVTAALVEAAAAQGEVAGPSQIAATAAPPAVAVARPKAPGRRASTRVKLLMGPDEEEEEEEEDG